MESWSEILDDYKVYLDQRGLASATVRAYLSDATQFAQQAAHAGHQPSDLDTMVAKAALDQILNRGCSNSHDRTYSRSSVRRKLAGVNSLLRYLNERAITLGLIQLKLPLLPPARSPAANVISKERLLDVLEAPDPRTLLGVRDAAIMALIILCGMRSGEVSGLNQSDLSIKEKCAKVEGADGSRLIWVPDYGLQRLSKWLALRSMYAKTTEAVFVEVGRSDVPPANARRLSARAVRKLALAHLKSVCKNQEGLTIRVLRNSASAHLVASDGLRSEIEGQYAISSRTLNSYEKLLGSSRVLAGHT